MTTIPAHRERAAETARNSGGPLSDLEVERINAYWRAANYLSVGQICKFADDQLHKAADFSVFASASPVTVLTLPAASVKLRFNSS